MGPYNQFHRQFDAGVGETMAEDFVATGLGFLSSLPHGIGVMLM